jgi:hypothetical protein
LSPDGGSLTLRLQEPQGGPDHLAGSAVLARGYLPVDEGVELRS